MEDATDYAGEWDRAHRNAYAEGRKHWRAELASPPAFQAFMASRYAPPRGARVLEAGCSDGLNAVGLTKRGYVVTGVDVAPSAIARAKETAAEAGAVAGFLCMDLVREAPPHSGEYALWVDSKTLHCLWEDEDRRRYLANAANALKPRGIFFLNCGLALSDVRTHFPAVFEALSLETQAHAGTEDRDLPPEQRKGIRCETLEWYCDELLRAGLTIREAKREASLETGWGAVIVARKPAE